MNVTAGYDKLRVFEQIRQGLQEGIAHAQGKLSLKTTTMPKPVPKLTKSRVVAIRKKLSMSQAVFASYLNVPTKTLQSWEQGAREPKASEARLLQIIEHDPERAMGLVSAASEGRSREQASRGRQASKG
ncbi:MAG: helix-turn-helix domain-containing protein [Planctomycetes bacterium]|nr:helix-turn-helix domain-containing protein [Planctomycetota bacterium]